MLRTLRRAILKVWKQSHGIFHNLVHGFLQSKISTEVRTRGNRRRTCKDVGSLHGLLSVMLEYVFTLFFQIIYSN